MKETSQTQLTSMQLKDLRYLSQTDLWPNWPVQTLKRHLKRHLKEGGFPTLATVYDTSNLSGQGVIVYEDLNIFKGWSKEEEKAAPRHEYPNYKAMILDGWVVD